MHAFPLLVLSLLLTSIAQAAADAARPNILWITSEDNSKHFVRLFDPAGAPMPHLEKLAAQGLVFDRAFSNAPVCSVARSTLITGSYAPRIGSLFHRRSQLAPMPDGLRMFPAYLRESGYYTTNNVKTDYNLKDESPWNESSGKATWRGRAPGQPFFHVQNHTVTHEGGLHFTAEDYARLRNTTPSDSVRLFPVHPDTALFRYTYARYHDRIRALDDQIGALIQRLETDGLREDTIIFYFGDHGGVLPGSKGYLYETGLHVPLVVYFPEKWRHLAPAAPGSRVGGFVSFIDLPPTVLHLAGLPVPAAIDGRAFLGAGIGRGELESRDETYASADRFDEKYDLVRSVRKGRFKYLRSYQPMNPDALHNAYRYQMLAYSEWRELAAAGKLNPAQQRFFEPRAPEALYDLETDPFELNNLAADPTFAATLRDLRARLTAWVKGMPDLGFIPEPVLLREAWKNPVAYGQTHRASLARLIDIADLALEPFAQARGRIEAALKSDAPWERYWALIVCSAHGRAAEPVTSLARQLAGADPERLVRVRAAEFLALTGAADPQPVLAAALQAAADPVEANLILNTVVLLRDHPNGLTLRVDAEGLPQAWRNDPSLELNRRLVYLRASTVAPSAR